MKPITSLDLVSINADEKVSDAWKKFKKQSDISRLIVMENDNPIKILSMSDIGNVSQDKPIKEIFQKLDLVNIVHKGDNLEKTFSGNSSRPITIVQNDTDETVGIITPSEITRFAKTF